MHIERARNREGFSCRCTKRHSLKERRSKSMKAGSQWNDMHGALRSNDQRKLGISLGIDRGYDVILSVGAPDRYDRIG